MKKRRLINKELCDPDWIHKKQQDFFALKNQFQRMEWGCAYIPDPCYESMRIIRDELIRMDEPMKAWKVEKPRYYKKK